VLKTGNTPLFVDVLNLEELGILCDEQQVGCPEYDPRAMLKLLVYGYSYSAERSSRKLERALHHNMSFICNIIMSNPLSIGIIGAGVIVRQQHLPAMLRQPERLKITAIADTDPERGTAGYRMDDCVKTGHPYIDDDA